MCKQLFNICTQFKLPQGISVVIDEPYIPFIPKNNWNRVLVLAESQNLSKTNKEYVASLLKSSLDERIYRLHNIEDIGIEPWDDNSLKLAISSAFKYLPESCAVSNAILWSQIDYKNNNLSPSNDLIQESTKLWNRLLPELNPKHIITAGKKAGYVIENIPTDIWSGKVTKLRSPSRTAMSRVSGMFNKNDLLSRYKEVHDVIDVHSEWVKGGYSLNKIFYACHAVSQNYEN